MRKKAWELYERPSAIHCLIETYPYPYCWSSIMIQLKEVTGAESFMDWCEQHTEKEILAAMKQANV